MELKYIVPLNMEISHQLFSIDKALNVKSLSIKHSLVLIRPLGRNSVQLHTEIGSIKAFTFEISFNITDLYR